MRGTSASICAKFSPFNVTNEQGFAAHSQKNPPLSGSATGNKGECTTNGVDVYGYFADCHALVRSQRFCRFSPFNGLELDTYASEVNWRGGIYCLGGGKIYILIFFRKIVFALVYVGD